MVLVSVPALQRPAGYKPAPRLLCGNSAAHSLNRTTIFSSRGRKFANRRFQSQAGLDPEPPYLAVADAQELSSLGLGPAVVKCAGKDLAQLQRQALGSFVQGAPAVELGRVLVGPVRRIFGQVDCRSPGV